VALRASKWCLTTHFLASSYATEPANAKVFMLGRFTIIGHKGEFMFRLLKYKNI
jgi:hypothetical protein